MTASIRRAPAPTDPSERIDERADLRRPANVRAAAELAGVAGDLHHAHLLAVLLAEEHHRPELAGFLDRRHERADGQVLEDLLVHAPLDLGALLRRQLLADA